MATYSAGIDFGTSNSSAAVTGKNAPYLVPVEQDHLTIPTALYFTDDGKSVFFGRAAQDCYTNEDSYGRFMRSMKRILGTSLMKSSGTQIGNRLVRFDKIIEFFVKHLKEKIDMAAGTKIDNAVMGRPVHFRDNDPMGDLAAEQELRQIALNSGFKNVEFQFEPIAAAFAHERLIRSEKLAIVIDIGGGTSDFTIIRLSPDRIVHLDRTSDVLSNTGVRVGGNDFDKHLSLKSFMPLLGHESELNTNNNQIIPMPGGPFLDLSTWNKVGDLYTHKFINNIKEWLYTSRSPEKLKRFQEVIVNRLGHRNLEYVENTKIRLSDTDQIEQVLDFISDRPTVFASRSDFESAIQLDIEKIQKSIQECLTQSGVKRTDINLVILTGGSTEIPHINNVMKSYFPDAELSASDKMSSVGLGLAYDSMRRF